MTDHKITPEEFIAGTVLLIDKPLYWTSFDVVKKIKALLRHRLKIKKIKVGHAGTLDPLATGLLIICTGKKTKGIETYQNQKKEYTGTFFLGASTPSSDLETQPDEFYPTDHIDADLVQKATEIFTGEIEQIPPLFSAKKIEGERAYFHARRGDPTILKPNKVFIHQFEITRFELPEADFRIVCSKGTYIRAIARDFGKETRSGAYLKALRRTGIGDFSVNDAWSIDDLENFFANNAIRQP